MASLSYSRYARGGSSYLPTILLMTWHVMTWQVCTGCSSEDQVTAEICSSPCLTACEREVLAALSYETATFIRGSESWLCRAVNDGLMTSDYRQQPFTVWMTSALVAMLQVYTATPA